MPLVELTDVHKTFPAARGGTQVEAIRGVDLSVDAGEIVGIVGYSGAGKSTLVRLVNALEPTTSGSVRIDGHEITGLKERELRAVREGIGMIFQQFNLFRSRTVWGNIAYPLEVAGVPKDERHRRISDLLHFVGLAEKAHSHVEELSGGQKQRVGIARALATNPSLLLADESTSALDPETTQEVLALLRRVNRELGITIIVITHEMDVVRSLAHRVVVMEAGRIVEQGPVLEVLANPQQPVTRRFVATIVDDEPGTEALAALRARHAGTFVKLAFRGDEVRQSDVFAALLEHRVRFELVFGGIEEVQGDTFGNLTLALDGEPDDVRAAVAAVGALVPTTELTR
ncbi:methionine ABC transporter ATP-binding protein [Nocardioides oleivorans]|uniref:Methionine ABC transporter ATP-binding protein n=1 Tax=Nocardioides oleivorans TaxID=273676 RepID=A0A4Q2RXV9_9ACTN|nr:methionine ABC transporter ATP-binding protein [Nocardioides oleivorans]RYB93626.1 methionine ABC transporter ATP-binding protein [Nocardioides oleivorans]